MAASSYLPVSWKSFVTLAFTCVRLPCVCIIRDSLGRHHTFQQQGKTILYLEPYASIFRMAVAVTCTYWYFSQLLAMDTVILPVNKLCLWKRLLPNNVIQLEYPLYQGLGNKRSTSWNSGFFEYVVKSTNYRQLNKDRELWKHDV